MGCAGGSDVNGARVLQLAERADDVAAVAFFEGVQTLLIPIDVEIREKRQMLRMRRVMVGIARAVFLRRLQPYGQILDKAFLQMRIRQLLSENGRNTHGDIGLHALFKQVLQHIEQGQIGFRHAFVEVFFAEGPHTCLAVVGQMAVQHQDKRSETHP